MSSKIATKLSVRGSPARAHPRASGRRGQRGSSKPFERLLAPCDQRLKAESNRNLAAQIAAAMASPIWLVDTFLQAVSEASWMSPVRLPAAMAWAIAVRIASRGALNLKLKSSIIAAERIWAMGFAELVPAIS